MCRRTEVVKREVKGWILLGLEQAPDRAFSKWSVADLIV